MRRLILLLATLAGFASADEAIHLLPGLAVTRIPAALTAGMPWPQRTELSAGAGEMWLLGEGNLWRLGARSGVFFMPLKVTSFVRSDGGAIAALVDGKLGLVSGRMFLPAIAAPDADMRLAAGAGDSVYLYGAGTPARILRFDGERVSVLATIPDPVTALTHLGDTVIFSTRQGIFTLRPGEAPGLLFPLSGHTPLLSLVARPDTAELFASSEDAVYQIDEGRMTQIAQGLGGALAIFGADILVADPRRQGVFTLGRQR